MVNVTNEEFLQAVFGEDAPWSHVTSFHDDPSDIPNNKRLKCWAGGYASQTFIQPNSNQYFTISTFYCDEQQKARRRKALFRATHVIVADDVKEKLPEANVLQLPSPTYKLETSPGSEQWGWILDVPCAERHKVENLLDGLVAQGLAPAGKDPGMKGVTRYVRLPEGCNTKKTKLVDGQPVRCRMLEWVPERRVSLEDLAAPFGVDLDAVRRESRTDGAADLPDHPLLDLADIITVKEVRSDGRFDITCPWVDEHTNAADDGAAVFTNNDGSVGFKCHHGSCEQRTGRHLLDRIEEDYPNFRTKLSAYKIRKVFESDAAALGSGDQAQPAGSSKDLSQLTFMPEETPSAPQSPESLTGIVDPLQELITELKRTPHTSEQARQLAVDILKAVDELPHIRRIIYHDEIRDHMQWNQANFKAILAEERSRWYDEQNSDVLNDVYRRHSYVVGIGAFYDPLKNMLLKPDMFRNGYSNLNEDILTDSLIGNRITKVDAVGYSPGYPERYTEDGMTFVNAWCGDIIQGVDGDPTPWLDHFDALGWSGADKEHLLGWMAYTLQRPELKINHAVILGGGEGVGKDMLMQPMMLAMQRNATIIKSDDLCSDFNEYLFRTKVLQINELDAGNYAQANAITNRIKGIVTTPPDHLRINQKNIPAFNVRNIINVWAGTNEAQPLKISADSRRFFVLWSDLKIRDPQGDVYADWAEYFDKFWRWLRDDQGWKFCVKYLMDYDLSKFNPKAAPVVTDAMRDMQEASMDPVLGAFVNCVKEKISLFKSDLMTITDIYQVMRGADLGGMGFNIKQMPSSNVLGKIIKQSNLTEIVRVYDDRQDVKIYCVRNTNRYSKMEKKQVLEQYRQQMSAARSMSTLNVVPNEREVV